MRGRASSNSRQSSRSACRRAFLIGVELAHGETAAARQAAKRVREPGSQARDIVECEHVTVVGRDEQLPLVARECPDRSDVRIDERSQHLR